MKHSSLFRCWTCCLIACCLALSTISVAHAETAIIRVLDATEKPVPGAEVAILDLGRITDSNRWSVLTTDEAGRVVTERTPSPLYKGVLGRVTIYKRGLAPIVSTIRAGDNIFRLSAGRSLSGMVRDREGKPVIGTPLTTKNIYGTDANFSLIGHPFRAHFTATTDNAGRWTLQDLPLTGRVVVGLEGEGIVHHELWADLAATNELPVLQARPAAFLEGRVLDSENQPIAGVEIMALPTTALQVGAFKAQSDATGRFRLSGLATGTYTISPRAPEEKELVAPPLTGMAAREGETIPLPNLVLNSGAVVTGRVVDSETGTPVSGSYISGTGGNSSTVDAEGRYRLRIAAGPANLYLGVPQDYLNETNERNITLALGESTVIDFRLKRAATFEGVARDETGKPVADLKITVTQQYSRKNDITDVGGHFSIPGLKPGEMTIEIQGAWDFITPRKVSLPLRTPLVLTLKRASVMIISGRVVDTRGFPMAGASVTISASKQLEGNVWSSDHTQLVTDADGRYEWREIRPGANATISVSKNRHRVVTPAKVAANREIMGISGVPIPNPNPVYQVSDAVLQPMQRVLQGRVIDEAGAAVAGATVIAPRGNPEVKAVTDFQGRWTLIDLPEGDFSLMAADASRFGETQPDAPQVTIVLKPLTAQKRDLVQARAILREIIENHSRRNSFRHEAPAVLAPYDWEGALELIAILNANRANNTPRASDLVMLASSLKQVSPTLAHEKLSALVTALPADGDTMSMYMATQAASITPDWSLKVLTKARGSLSAVAAKPTSQDIFTRLYLANLASVLKQPGAAEFVDEATALALLRNEPAEQQMFPSIVEGVAFDPALVERVLAKTPAGEWAATVARAIPILAKNDLPAARRLLDTMAEKAANGDASVGPRIQEYFGGATVAVVRRLAPAATAAALRLARRVNSASYRSRALALIAPNLPKEQAAALFREAFDGVSDWDEGIRPWIAAVASQSNAELGSRFFDEIGLQLGANARGHNNSAIAFAMAPYRPGHARLLLESAWGIAQADRLPGVSSSYLWPTTVAMSAIDANRALKMVRSHSSEHENDNTNESDHEEYQRWQSQGKIAQYLLLPAESRHTLLFNTWFRNHSSDQVDE
jgi:protocatechuate 3,4-dioxygenase beta subunit